ncbi:MAG: Mur ligase domain-containing protein [Anaerovoracaceae bacterium]
MKTFTIGEILKATGGELICGSPADEVRGFAIDSRETGVGDMFFATKGARNDAHDFLANVIEKGCRALVISDMNKLPAEKPDDLSVIVTEDTLKALQELPDGT